MVKKKSELITINEIIGIVKANFDLCISTSLDEELDMFLDEIRKDLGWIETKRISNDVPVPKEEKEKWKEECCDIDLEKYKCKNVEEFMLNISINDIMYIVITNYEKYNTPNDYCNAVKEDLDCAVQWKLH